MKQIAILLGLIVLLGFSPGCKNKKKESKEGFTFDQEAEKRSDIEITKSFIYLFPSPGEIMDRLSEANLQFDADNLHNPNLADRYMTSRDQGLNLGVYITDMAYSALFDRGTTASKYMDVVRKLSNEMNISSTVFENLIDRAKANTSNKDSLVQISNEFFYNMVEYLEYSGKESTVAVISCGAYVEALYISFNSIEEYNEYNPIIRQIAEFKYPMENLLSNAESASSDPNVQSILKYITELNGLFEEIEAESGQIEKDEPGVLSLNGGSLPRLTPDNFRQIREKVFNIREYIVGL